MLVGVLVGPGVKVLVGVAEGGRGVRDGRGVIVFDGVKVAVFVRVGVLDCSGVFVGTWVAVLDGVKVAVLVGVLDGVLDGVRVAVGADVAASVDWASKVLAAFGLLPANTASTMTAMNRVRDRF